MRADPNDSDGLALSDFQWHPRHQNRAKPKLCRRLAARARFYGNDGLTWFERRRFAQRWLNGPGSKDIPKL